MYLKYVLKIITYVVVILTYNFYVLQYIFFYVGYKITKRLRELLFKSILSQETAYFDRHKTGELINRLSSDCYIVSQAITTNISDGLRSTIMVVSGVSFMVF